MTFLTQPYRWQEPSLLLPLNKAETAESVPTLAWPSLFLHSPFQHEALVVSAEENVVNRKVENPVRQQQVVAEEAPREKPGASGAARRRPLAEAVLVLDDTPHELRG